MIVIRLPAPPAEARRDPQRVPRTAPVARRAGGRAERHPAISRRTAPSRKLESRERPGATGHAPLTVRHRRQIRPPPGPGPGRSGRRRHRGPRLQRGADLEPSVHRLHAYLDAGLPVPAPHHHRRQRQHRRHLRIAQPARRRAHRTCAPSTSTRKAAAARCGAVWSASDAPVLAYMDVDLSTDLAALLPLVAPLLSGHSDLAIGTRLAAASRVVRGAKRELISRCYNLILQPTLRAASPTPSADSRPSAPTSPGPAAAGRGHRLVLRHRTAGAGRAERAAHPRGARRLGRRPRQPGRHRRHRHRRPQRVSDGLLRGLRPAAIHPRDAIPAMGSQRSS